MHDLASMSYTEEVCPDSGFWLAETDQASHCHMDFDYFDV